MCRIRGAEPADLKALKETKTGGWMKDKKFLMQTIIFKGTDINCFI